MTTHTNKQPSTYIAKQWSVDHQLLEQHAIDCLDSDTGRSRGPRRLLFLWHTDRDASLYSALLGSDELHRASRLVEKSDQAKFIVCRALVRIIVGQLTNTEPKKVRLPQDDRGKPCCPDLNGTISWSRSGDFALLGLSTAEKMGADIERLRPIEQLHAIADQHFSCTERALLASRRNAIDQQSAFFRIWTLKEAYVKALGRGLEMPLASFSVAGDDGRYCAPGDGWEVESLLCQQYAIAIAQTLRPFPPAPGIDVI